jgi:hypothetical protein
MKIVSIALLFLMIACAPVSQTVTNVSRFVQGVQIFQYQAALADVSLSVSNTAMAMQMGGSYTPLVVKTETAGALTVSSKPLKGSIARAVQAEAFSIDISFVETASYTEVTFRPSDIDHQKAQEVIKSLLAELDKQFTRYTGQ